MSRIKSENLSLKQKYEKLKKEDEILRSREKNTDEQNINLKKKCNFNEIEINKIKSENKVLQEENEKIKNDINILREEQENEIIYIKQMNEKEKNKIIEENTK